jgi:hypothetical protein
VLFIPWMGVWAALGSALVAAVARAWMTYIMGERKTPIGLPVREMLLVLAPIVAVVPLGMWNWQGVAWPMRVLCKSGLLGVYAAFVLAYTAKSTGGKVGDSVKEVFIPSRANTTLL